MQFTNPFSSTLIVAFFFTQSYKFIYGGFFCFCISFHLSKTVYDNLSTRKRNSSFFSIFFFVRCMHFMYAMICSDRFSLQLKVYSKNAPFTIQHCRRCVRLKEANVKTGDRSRRRERESATEYRNSIGGSCKRCPYALFGCDTHAWKQNIYFQFWYKTFCFIFIVFQCIVFLLLLLLLLLINESGCYRKSGGW